MSPDDDFPLAPEPDSPRAPAPVPPRPAAAVLAPPPRGLTLTIPWPPPRPDLRTVWLTLLTAVVLWHSGLHLPAWHVPGPVPPIPGPPAPAVKEFRCIVAYESSAELTRGQLDALGSTAVREYLNKHCLKDGDGRPAWRFWDKDIDTSNESDSWKAAWATARAKLGTLPQVFVSRADGPFDALPMPSSEDELLALLKKYGGA